MFYAHCVFHELYDVDMTCIILQETTYVINFVMEESFLALKINWYVAFEKRRTDCGWNIVFNFLIVIGQCLCCCDHHITKMNHCHTRKDTLGSFIWIMFHFLLDCSLFMI